MMVSHRHRCIFAHAPKCAGTSIKLTLGLEFIIPPYWHCTWDEARTALGNDTFDSYTKFAVVRNPWDRVISAWKMFEEKPWCRQPRSYSLSAFIDVIEDESIPYRAKYRNEQEQNEWMMTVENIRHHTLPCLHPYYGLVDDSGNLAVDHVIKFELLDEGFNDLLDRLGVPRQTLIRENTTRHEHYSTYFDDSNEKRVAKYFARDVELFGYRFESPGRLNE